MKYLRTKNTDPIKKVLLVEDDPVVRWLVRTSFRDECLLLTSATADNAIETYYKCQPDMVLLDIGLPDRDGIDVLTFLTRQDPNAYIVMFSAQDAPQTISECFENGAKGFISKPFHKKEVLEHMSACFKHSKTRIHTNPEEVKIYETEEFS